MNEMKPETKNNVCEAPKILTVQPSPHIKSGVTTQKLMLDVIIALLPACLFGVYQFGAHAATLLIVGVASSVFFEWAFQRILGRRVSVGDLSAVVTGLLISMNLPSTVPFWLPIIGSFVAIVVVKQLFGGIGKNFLNPALAARIFLFLSWSDRMATFTMPRWVGDAVDTVAYATPLASLAENGTTGGATILDMFLGRTGGCIGEMSALLLILGGIYLIVRRVITWHIPICYLGTVALFALLLPENGGAMFDLNAMLMQLLSGGLILGAIFMATDYVTSPITKWGRVIFGIGCGLITVLFRRYSSYPEGTSFAILVMNSLVWYIDRMTKPRVFGGAKHGK